MSNNIYHEGIKQLARTVVSTNKYAKPDVSVRLDNRLCGDRILLDICLNGEMISHIYHQVRGCLLCEAAANALADAGIGATVTELRQITEKLTQMLSGVTPTIENNALFNNAWHQLNLFTPVSDHKSRHQCVLLPFEAMLQALTENSSHKNTGCLV